MNALRLRVQRASIMVRRSASALITGATFGWPWPN
jgi:hypothetical protein